MTVMIEVNLKELRCLDSSGDTFPESPNQLEIRGGLGVSVGTTATGPGNRESHTLFRKPDNQGVEVYPSNPLVLNSRKQFEVRPNEFVWIGGVLVEEDGASADDSLGDQRPNISFIEFNNMTDPFRKAVRFSSTGQVIEAIYEFRRV
ncbi:hypothetical protein [Bacillus toyonensis]|uniref:Uncharacterized protein n=1 Tax=Bacillus toyonensis TaxID=155322 RepID=A0A2B7V1J0_9BACI|nr:hypothetical protein [Bacillus toyonensis]PEJ82125.1 hypothetical protein CN688_32830 [Bacillus toyonensis]PEK70709.1 hypothetical protein CN594_35050 [Bacillus toyonensis]PEL13991.1 hypothetical protein CN624_33090 [Bacillus toyonensis]PEO42190.1 hypothetical protein CN579_34055 [Bacillus toyonensis]PFY28436.1 hypothetical protein COL54_34770 [Bacillus toyonensis]